MRKGRKPEAKAAEVKCMSLGVEKKDFSNIPKSITFISLQLYFPIYCVSVFLEVGQAGVGVGSSFYSPCILWVSWCFSSFKEGCFFFFLFFLFSSSRLFV